MWFYLHTIFQLLVFVLCVCTFTLSQAMIMGFTIYHKNNTNKKMKIGKSEDGDTASVVGLYYWNPIKLIK